MALVASAAFCARLAILAVLVAAGVAGISRVEFQLIAYALAVTSAVQVIVDSSTAGAFTVINWDRYEAIGKSLWAGVLRLQAIAAVFVFVGVMAIVGAVAHSREGLLVGAAVGAAAMAENLARFARCRYQRGLKFRQFAAVDLTLGRRTPGRRDHPRRVELGCISLDPATQCARRACVGRGQLAEGTARMPVSRGRHARDPCGSVAL